MAFPRITPLPRTGAEPLHASGESIGLSVLDYWRWSASDLLSNATRGILAEFIVASALGIPISGVRDEWSPYDLLTPDGLRVEVKSAAYIQSWHQSKPSIIRFGIGKTRAWNVDTNILDTDIRRQADVYVFALLATAEQEAIDPLDVHQWKFYVVPTTILDKEAEKQKGISLTRVATLSGGPVPYAALEDSVRGLTRVGSNHA